MNGPAKFTIVTPALNRVRYVAETIESVLAQAGDFELEYLVMDGGSMDGSVEVIRSYAERVKNGGWPTRCRAITMRWASAPDGGQSEAINRGLRQASGNIVAYINSDDAYLPGAFGAVAKIFERNPAASFVHGDGEVVDEEGRLQWEWLSRPYDHSVMTSYHFLWNGFTNYIMQQSTFWRPEVRAVIGEFDESFHFAMDAEYWIRAGQAQLRFHHLPQKLARFRLMSGTKSLSSPLAFWSDQLEIFRRYRGVQRMAIFFAYYCYNVALHNGFDLDHVRHEEVQLRQRWTFLPLQQQAVLERQARKGFALGCCIIANELMRQEQFGAAAAALRRANAEWPSIKRHPIALYSKLKQSLPLGAARYLDVLANRLSEFYRRKKIEYRYHEK